MLTISYLDDLRPCFGGYLQTSTHSEVACLWKHSARLYASMHSFTAGLHDATMRTFRPTLSALRSLCEATVNLLCAVFFKHSMDWVSWGPSPVLRRLKIGVTPRYKSGFSHRPKPNHPVDIVVNVHYPCQNFIPLV